MAKPKAVRNAAQTTKSRRELDRETSRILRLKSKIAENFWDLGDSLVRVNDKKLFRAAGYSGFDEYLQKEVKIGRSTAYRLMDLARNFSRETAVQFGQTKLLCAIEYAEATPEPDLPLDVTRYEFEGKNRSGKKVKKSFKQATTREIKRAADLLRRKLKSKKLPSPLPIPSLPAFLSGKTPKLLVAPFLKSAKEKLKAISPRPVFSLAVARKGEDPVVDLRLSGVRASRLMEALGYVTAAAMETWMESMR